MNKAVLVTIIIPTYNGLEFLGDCLFSLSQQTMKNCEVIVVDNNSADGSIDYLKKIILRSSALNSQKIWVLLSQLTEV